MNLHDYKELMRFYILMDDDDLSIYNYAAVDYDGALWVYEDHPDLDFHEPIWVNVATNATKIYTLSPQKYWKETLIEL